MKKSIKLAGIIALSISSLCSCNNANKSVELTNLRDSASYCLGYIMGRNLAQQSMDSLNYEALKNGAELGATTPDDMPITQEEIQEILMKYNQERMEIQFADVINESKAFFKENGEKEGVITTASGLQYKIIEEGTGEKPNMNDTIYVSYIGKKLNGETFDSSATPVAFSLSYLIPCFQEAFPLFKEGTKAIIYSPYDLAYGAQGNYGIEPFSSLIFEVTFDHIVKGVDSNQISK